MTEEELRKEEAASKAWESFLTNWYADKGKRDLVFKKMPIKQTGEDAKDFPAFRTYIEKSTEKHYRNDKIREALFEATDIDYEDRNFPLFCLYYHMPFKQFMERYLPDAKKHDATVSDYFVAQDKDTGALKIRIEMATLLGKKEANLLEFSEFEKNFNKTMGQIIKDSNKSHIRVRKNLKEAGIWMGLIGTVSALITGAYMGLAKIGSTIRDSFENRPAPIEQKSEINQAPKPPKKAETKKTQPATMTQTPTTQTRVTPATPVTVLKEEAMKRMTDFEKNLVKADLIPQFRVGNKTLTSLPTMVDTKTNQPLTEEMAYSIIYGTVYSQLLYKMHTNLCSAMDTFVSQNSMKKGSADFYDLPSNIVEFGTPDQSTICVNIMGDPDMVADNMNSYRANICTAVALLTPEQQMRYIDAVGLSIGLSKTQQETWQKMNSTAATTAFRTIYEDVKSRFTSPKASVIDCTIDAIRDYREAHPENPALGLTGASVLNTIHMDQARLNKQILKSIADHRAKEQAAQTAIPTTLRRNLGGGR